MISALAPNGSVYGSQPEKAGEIVRTVDEIGPSRLQNNHFVVHISEGENAKERTNHRISIVRYLSDLNVNNAQEGYAKVDIYDKAVENMLGGISNDGLKLGTMILSGDTMVYTSDGTLNQLSPEESKPFTSRAPNHTAGNNQIMRMNWNGQPYLISSTINTVTGWTVIHYIPVAQITDTFLSNTLNYVFISILALIAALALAFFFHRYFIHPILKLSGSMKIVDSEHLAHTVIQSNREDEIGRLINSYNAMIYRIKTSRESEITASSLQKKAELKMLQSQINPHFLYNTLNAIHSISELHRMDHISTMTKSLSSIYRYNIKYGDVVTVGKELEQVEHYIQIQQIRFFNKFQVEYNIDDDVLDCKIIKFLIQPIIENSFYHGLEPKGGTGVLRLTIKRRRQFLYISVYDNGIGIPEEKLTELRAMLKQDEYTLVEDLDRNFGMRNVHARIKHFYGASCWMNVISEEQAGTTIMMHIPFNKEVSTHENFSSR
ncbi:Histidine kinase-, DNA gyrase B-, and HSP90-like ATPase [Paenibacillus uliginis N3/975]|uniref:Histidine kinase-, DNA gyrase B-, and HSP90-like ATPase n=1 Tax=Paenibacillus uliginis N3/975 TaxID=1313296 RepID=A0A1X7HT41_9BACL|nr:histidine kinase [Paenibacillus uliginis]SMF91431.1 Histidine kinase-, DNA gyrase B-, and HSP90-like ATPase [Paenibacillus uliginis N3/975]